MSWELQSRVENNGYQPYKNNWVAGNGKIEQWCDKVLEDK
jgi:hypothetical protein